jgi:hypothetical protein
MLVLCRVVCIISISGIQCQLKDGNFQMWLKAKLRFISEEDW